LLRGCLASLREHPPACALHVRVVDNASGDGTGEMVQSEFPVVELIENPVNRGFAAAANQGIRAGNARFVLALNPDCELGEGTRSEVAEEFRPIEKGEREPRMTIRQKPGDVPFTKRRVILGPGRRVLDVRARQIRPARLPHEPRGRSHESPR
jgi:GT2 family glycosyltransferase